MFLSDENKMRVLHVLKKSTAISDEMLDASNWDKPLTGYYYKLLAIDLVYLLFELEEEFNIKILYESLENYQFSTINGICEIIQERL